MGFDINRISEYTLEELQAFREEFDSQVTAALETETPTREQAQAAVDADAAIQAIDAEVAQRQEAQEAFAALRASRQAPPEPAATTPEPEPAPEPQPQQTAATEPEPAPAPEPTAPQPRQSAGALLAGQQDTSTPPAPEPEDETPSVSIIASADVAGFTAGATLDDFTSVAQAIAARTKAIPKFRHDPRGGMVKMPTAQFHVQFPDHLVATDGDEEGAFAAIEAAANEHSLSGGNLVAAGGWCAPSETLYDLCDIEGDGGIIDLPEFAVRRGGIRVPGTPDFSEMYNAGFIQTEAQAIAGTTKPCFELDCPTFTDQRLDVDGLCLRFPLLTRVGWPELIANVTKRTLLAHRHRMSAEYIARMVALSEAAITVPSVGSTASNTLAAFELVAEQTAQEYRLSENATLEAVLPMWVLAAFRADLAQRNGVDMLAVSNAQIRSYLASRRVRAQFVYGWQDMTVGDNGFPATFTAMLYPAGTFTKGTAAVIDLNTIYDTASLQENMYTGLFTEEGFMIHKRCYKSKQVTITVCSSGVTGAASNVACLTDTTV